MGSEARARVGLVGLLLATLFTFGQIYGDGAYLGPALLAILVAGGLAVAARRLGMGVWSTTLASTVVMLWYLVLIFESGQAWYGFPTAGALRGVWDAMSNAWAASSLDYAPVPLRPGYVVLTVVGMWWTTTWAEIATFRWKRPHLASLPAIALFSMLIIVGTGRGDGFITIVFLSALLTFWALESAHHLRSWGRWVHAWSRDEDSDPGLATWRVARRMGAAAIVGALVAPAVMPAPNQGLLSWRNPGGGGVGSGGAGRSVDLLVDIKPKILNQSEVEMFEIVSDRPAYWRLVSLVGFDGSRWTPQANTLRETPIAGEVVPVFQPTDGNYAEVVQRVDVISLGGVPVPAAVQPVRIDVTEREGRDNADLRFEQFGGELTIQGGLVEGLTYDVVSRVGTPAGFRSLTLAAVGVIGDDYTLLPADTDPRIGQIALDWTSGFDSPFEKLVALQNRFRDPSEFTYSTDVAPASGGNDLLHFLTEGREGYCQQFATAFAVLARSLGYPTRVNVGFLPGETSLEAPNRYLVRGTDAHAWPEVFFQEFGWVAFEPTPRSSSAASVAPAYTRPRTTFSGGCVADALVPCDPATAAAGAGGAGASGSDVGLPAGLPDEDRLRLDPTGGAGVPDAAEEDATGPWRDAFTRVAVVTAFAVLLFLALVPLVKEARIATRYRRARGPVERALAAFAHFEQEAADLATVRRPAQSATAYALSLAGVQKVPRPLALRLATIYEAALYSPEGVDAATAEEARRLARGLRAKLWSQATWWDIALRLFSPRSLVPARARASSRSRAPAPVAY